LVFTIFIYVLEFFESFDNVEVVPEIDDDVLRALVKAIIKYSKTLDISQ